MLWSSRQAGISGIRLRVVLLCFGILAEFLSKVTKVVTESWKFHFHGFDTRSSKQVTYSNPQREEKKKDQYKYNYFFKCLYHWKTYLPYSWKPMFQFLFYIAAVETVLLSSNHIAAIWNWRCKVLQIFPKASKHILVFDPWWNFCLSHYYITHHANSRRAPLL